MSDKQESKKPNPENPQEDKGDQKGKDEDNGGDNKEGGNDNSLDWLHDAANHINEDEKKPPKPSGDWIKDAGELV